MKRIEQIEVGDFVLARNDKLPNSPVVTRRINEVKHNPPSVTYHLKFRSNFNNKEISLRVTPEHPFYVDNRGWIAVENLNIGDSFVTVNNNKLELFSKRLDPELIPVYNLEVDVDHTYFVGDDPKNCVLVHNQYTVFDKKTNIKIFVEIKPDLNTGEISIRRITGKMETELARLKYVVKDGIGSLVSVSRHNNKELPGVASSVMKKISPILTDHLNKILSEVGGKIVGTTALSAAEIKAVKDATIKSVLGKITTSLLFGMGIVIEIFTNPNTAQAAEIERPIRILLSPKDIGLTEEDFDQLLDLEIPIDYTDVPPPVIIRGSRFI
jgi:hypothetical protein